MSSQTLRSRYTEPVLPPPTSALPPPPPPPQGPPPSEPPPPAPTGSLSRTASATIPGARPSTRAGSPSSYRQSGKGTDLASLIGQSHSASAGQQLGHQTASSAAAANGPSASGAGGSLSRQSSQSRPYPSSSSASYASSGGATVTPRTPSRTLLQQALALAQKAVLLDQESRFREALDVYRTTVSLLEKVMERVEAGERKRRERGVATVGGTSEDEGRTLQGIYDAYTSRIMLLSEQLIDETPSPALSSPPSSAHPYQSYPSSYAPNRGFSQSSVASSLQHSRDSSGAYDGIGAAMLSTSSSATSLASNSATVSSNATPSASVALSYHRPRPPSQLSVASTHSRNQSLSSAGTPPLNEYGGTFNPTRSNSRSVAVSAPGPPPSCPPPPVPSTSTSSAAASNRTSLLSSDGTEADMRRQSLLDSLELSLGPAGGRKISAAGLGLAGVDEGHEGTEGRLNTDAMQVLDKTPLQPEFALQKTDLRGQEVSRPGARLGETPVVLGTSEGTISQRRKAGGGGDSSSLSRPPDLSISAGSSSTRSSSIDLDPGGVRTAPQEPSIASSSTSSSTTPSPTPLLSSDSQLSLSATSVPKEKSGMFRLRALSQPGRRPSINTSGLASETQRPPVPVIQRKASFPAQPLGTGSPNRSLAPFSIGRSTSSGGVGSLRSASARSAASSREAFDHYPPVPPSPSFSINSSYTALGRSPVVRQSAGSVANSPSPEAIPAILQHRPFHLMRLLRTTMVTPGGAFLTKRMHVSIETWTLAGVHLQAVDAKVDALHQLNGGLQSLERSGSVFLARSGVSASAKDEENWVHALDAFERFIDGVQVALGKKLNMEFGGNVKSKSSGTSLTAMSNKFTRAVEKKFANGKNVNSSYVEELNRLFAQVQFLDEHLKHFTSSAPQPSPAYQGMSAGLRALVEQRLRRASEFFGQVVVVFVLRDLGLLMDKYSKGAERWLESV